LTGSPVAFRSRRASERGFTLLECLVAVAIAAVLLTILLQGFSAGLGSSARDEAWSGATVIAQSTLETLAATDPIVETDSEWQEGGFDVATSVHRYPVPDRAGVASVPYEFSVTVSWTDGTYSRSVDLRTLRLGPLNSGQAR
jgi:general secretion pathway protein I